MIANVGELSEALISFAATAARSPLYRVIAGDPARLGPALELVMTAPPAQRRPVMLFAAVHHSLLGAPDHPLAAWYRTLTEDHRDPLLEDPVPDFLDLCRRRAGEIEETISTRRVQTNEVGRSALFLVGLGLLGSARSDPLALVDLGTAAGLNLALDRYRYRYRPGGEIGPISPVVIDCGTRGSPPKPEAMPTIAERIGIDLEPCFDPDAEQRRWLQACVWSDEPERQQRLVAALDVAATVERRPITGDLVDSVASVVDGLGAGAHPVLLTSWVLDYLTAERQVEFDRQLDRLGRRHDLSWIAVESPERVGILGIDADPLTHLVVTTWRNGRRTMIDAARCHPHGHWLHWQV